VTVGAPFIDRAAAFDAFDEFTTDPTHRVIVFCGP
jgi:hypothetical protein